MLNLTERRERRIEVLKKRLLKHSSPRIHVSIIVLLTALAGFVTSFALLHMGLRLMWIRYPIAIAVAYFVFLLLLAVWLWLQRRSLDLSLDGVPDVLHYESTNLSITGSGSFGGGGDFGGGGAGGSWVENVSVSSTVSTSKGPDLPSLDVGLDSEELGFLVLGVVAIVGGLIASLYIVYIAPILLAEILVDGLLVAGLYKRVKHIEQRHWLKTALSRTALPAILVALFFTFAGWALQKAAPEARSIGEAWHHVMK